MKFIYLTNNIYEQDRMTNNINIINEQYIKENKASIEIIYGGNQSNSNLNISEEDYSIFLQKIKLLNETMTKYIMYGGLELGIGNENNFLIQSTYSYYRNDFKNIFIIDYKIINNTLLIFLNNQINYFGEDVLISNTSLKYLQTLEPEKYFNEMTIGNLIELEITELTKILKINLNIKSIIFISQSPLFICEYQKNKINVDKSLKFLEWVNRYFYLLKDLKIYWVCGDFNNRNETSIITLTKKDNEQNILNSLSINQYIIGTNYNSDNEELKQNLKIINETKEFKGQFEISDDYIDTKWTFEVKYTIDKINQNFGFISLDIQDNNSEPKFDFVSYEIIVAEKKDNELKNKDNELKNNELNTDIKITEEGDPYKEKYLKYKKKLIKLRNNKNKNKT